MEKSKLPFYALVGFLAAALGLGRWTPATANEREADEALELARQLSKAYQRLAAEVGPAVVQVRTFRNTSRGRRGAQDGSGVIVRSDGVIVTNHHVVRDADQFEVQLTNGRQLAARLVGTDKDTDIAVLAVDADGLAHAPLDPDANADVGEIVLAMGNPMGLGHTVTSGIVSGLGRSDLNIAFYEDFIQTDAAINPGNSGGPLINLRGEVIGINTAVGLASNGDDGIAFAIPGRMVRRVVDDILSYGEVHRGYLGVLTLSPWSAGRRLQAARADGYRGFSQIVVDEVEEGTPAERGGLLTGDIVLAIHGQRVTDQKSFRTAIADAPPGEEIEVDVWRAGDELAVPVTLELRK